MMTTKTARWLDLLAYLLQHRFAVTREQIFSQIRGYEGGGESARRKFERDKDELKRLGVEIETVPIANHASNEPAVGYRLAVTGIYLPYFELSEGPAREAPYRGLARMTLSARELQVLDRATRLLAQQGDHPLATAAKAARRKLEFDLPLAAEEVERVLGLPIPEEGRRALATWQGALADRVAIRFRYYSMERDVDEALTVEPYGLLFQWSLWYGVGRVRGESGIRVCRIDRMRRAERLEPAESVTVPDGFDVRAWAGRAPWELGEGQEVPVRVRFEFPESNWVQNRRLGRPVGEAGPSAALMFEFPVRDRAVFLRWVLTFGDRARVVAPESVATALGELRREVAALYDDGGG